MGCVTAILTPRRGMVYLMPMLLLAMLEIVTNITLVGLSGARILHRVSVGEANAAARLWCHCRYPAWCDTHRLWRILRAAQCVGCINGNEARSGTFASCKSRNCCAIRLSMRTCACFLCTTTILADGTVRLQQESGLWVNAWGYAAGVFSNYQSTLALGLGAVMLFSDLPLVREYALFEATRCSRNTWIGGRILYVGMISVLYASLLLLLCAFTSRGRLMETSDWGKLLNTLANGYGFGEYHVPVSLSLEVTQNLTPLAAFGLTVLMSALATAAMGLMMLCLSLSVGRIGAIAAGCMVAVLDFVIYQKLPFWCYLAFAAVLYAPEHCVLPEDALLPHLAAGACAAAGMQCAVHTAGLWVSPLQQGLCQGHM